MAKRQLKRPVLQLAILALLAIAVATQPGCVGALSQMIYMIKGHTVEPAFPGLDGKRVAVVCVSDASAYGPDTLTYTVSQLVGVRLVNGLSEESAIVAPARIEEWIDTHGWTETEFVELGAGVDADVVLAIEIGSYSLHEGSTLFKGRSDITATVYDVKKEGQVLHVFGPRHFAFPTNGRPAIQTTERQFERLYLSQLTTLISNQFVVHDKLESFASDAMEIQ